MAPPLDSNMKSPSQSGSSLPLWTKFFRAPVISLTCIIYHPATIESHSLFLVYNARSGTNQVLSKCMSNDMWHRCMDEKVNVLVSYCSCKKLPQTYWRETTPGYYILALEVRSLKWVNRLHAFWGFQGRTHFLVSSSFQRPPVFLDLQPLPLSSHHSKPCLLLLLHLCATL